MKGLGSARQLVLGALAVGTVGVVVGGCSGVGSGDNAAGADVIQGTDQGTTTDSGGGGCTSNCGEMVTVPGGPFMMGCNEAVDTDCYPAEKPYHEVNVPTFEIDKYEVTVSQYGDCVSTGACKVFMTDSFWCNWDKFGRGEHPMNCINWNQAREYCAWAGKRLCSESEWEKAARGTDGRKYPWGNATATCQYAVMDEDGDGCGQDTTWPVGSKPMGASPYGALDMSGNVWEWVEDNYEPNYTGAPTNGSAWVDGSGRVSRGGSFDNDYSPYLRASSRSAGGPDYGDYSAGARCCKTP